MPSLAVQRIKVLSAGVFSLVLALGVARFAYTPLLPLMRLQAGLGVAQAGWLATINYTGYLLGAVASSLIVDIAVKDKLYRTGLALAVASTAMMALTHAFWIWALSRFIAGLASAAGMLLGGALVLNWLVRHGQRPELGILFSGIGLGIALSAGAVQIMSPQLDWTMQWWAFTAIAALLLLPALGWLPRPERATTSVGGEPLTDRPPGRAFIGLLMAAYFCAGIGYVVSATFIVAIVDALPGLQGRGTVVFLWLGLASAPACVLWDLLARRTGDINALTLASVLQVAGILLPVWPGTMPFAVAGAVLFGASFVGIVSLVLTMAGRYYPTRPAKMMGRMTVAYGSAQIIAPAVTAQLATHFGGYASGLYLAAISMGLATALLLALRRLPRHGAAA